MNADSQFADDGAKDSKTVALHGLFWHFVLAQTEAGGEP
jgi:hypothetical protein